MAKKRKSRRDTHIGLVESSESNFPDASTSSELSSSVVSGEPTIDYTGAELSRALDVTMRRFFPPEYELSALPDSVDFSGTEKLLAAPAVQPENIHPENVLPACILSTKSSASFFDGFVGYLLCVLLVAVVAVGCWALYEILVNQKSQS
jgi:hypothetical protein